MPVHPRHLPRSASDCIYKSALVCPYWKREREKYQNEASLHCSINFSL